MYSMERGKRTGVRYRHLGILAQGGEKQCWAAGPHGDWGWNSWVLCPTWEEAIFPDWASERQARLPWGWGDEEQCLGKEAAGTRSKGNTVCSGLQLCRWPQPRPSCATLRVASGSSWAWLSEGAGSCLQPLDRKSPGSPKQSGRPTSCPLVAYPTGPLKAVACFPPDLAGASSAPGAATLFLLLLPPLTQGW